MISSYLSKSATSSIEDSIFVLDKSNFVDTKSITHGAENKDVEKNSQIIVESGAPADFELFAAYEQAECRTSDVHTSKQSIFTAWTREALWPI